MNRSNSANETVSIDEKRANYERMSMTVLAGDGSGYVNVANLSHNESGHAYSVRVEDGEAVGCSCAHATYRDAHCKHQCAVENNPLVVTSASCANETRVVTDGGEREARGTSDESDGGTDDEKGRFEVPDGPDVDDDDDDWTYIADCQACDFQQPFDSSTEAHEAEDRHEDHADGRHVVTVRVDEGEDIHNGVFAEVKG